MALEASDIDKLVASIVPGALERYVAELTSALIDDLMDGVFSGSAEQRLETLARANRAKVDTLLMRYRDKINAEIMDSVQDALSRADAGDVSSLDAIYGANTAAGAVAAARASGASAHAQEIAYQTARGLSEIIDRQNIALAERAERVWYEVAGDAITATNHGLKPRDKVIADAVAKLAAASIDTIDYKSGIHSQLDVAVRRHLVSQTSQAGGEMTLARLNQYDHTLVRVSAHYGARPTHDAWQGKAYSLKGRKTIDGVTYDDFYAATEYGSVAGLKGVNCRHSFGPYYPGITQLPDLDFPRESSHFGMTSEQYYEATQRQRELERRVRKTKREIAALERAGLGLESPSYVQKRLLLGKQQGTLREHVADSRLERQYAREKAYGVGAQPRALKVLTRGKARLVKGKYPVTQEQIDALVDGKLSGVRFSARPTYDARINSFGLTSIKRDKNGRRSTVVKIGKQKRPGDAELIDTLIHEELEARIALNTRSRELYYHFNGANGDVERHAYIQKIIDRYVKMRGIK